MKILIVGLGAHDHHEASWKITLENMDHKVLLYDYKKDLNSFPGYIKQRTLLFLGNINKKLLSLTENFSPDIVFLYRALLITKDTIIKIKSNGIKVVVYNLDNCFSPEVRRLFWRNHKESIPFFDHIFAYRNTCKENYMQQGAKNCSVLKPYYVPWLHWKDNIKSFEERKYDICFIGHCENDERMEVIDKLYKNKNYNLLVRGKYWKEKTKKYSYNKIVGGPLLGSKYTDAIADSRIALTFFSRWNRDLYTRRVWEIPAIGTVLSSPLTMPMLSIYNDKECVYFSNQIDVIECLEPVLNDKLLWQQYMSNIRSKVQKESFSIIGRVKEFMSILNEITN